MPIIDEDTPYSKMLPKLHNFVQSGLFSNYGKTSLPESFSIADKVTLLEFVRKTAIENNYDCTPLRKAPDYAEWIDQRRPDPSRDQWLWLFQNIGARYQILSVDEVCGIMAGRDALLPFVSFAPDIRLQKHYEKFFGTAAEDDDPSPLPYPNLEEAINNDAPGRVSIYRLMCRNVTDEQIINRAVFLQKLVVVVSLLKNLPCDMKIRKLIKFLRSWISPEFLLYQAIKEFLDDLTAWQDEYDNVFFWYLYTLPSPVSKTIVDLLPDKLLTIFDQLNCYGISPEDVWKYYRAELPQSEKITGNS